MRKFYDWFLKKVLKESVLDGVLYAIFGGSQPFLFFPSQLEVLKEALLSPDLGSSRAVKISFCGILPRTLWVTFLGFFCMRKTSFLNVGIHDTEHS